jgi:hypothetical protein
MIDILKRQEMQILRTSGHTLREITTLSVSVWTARRTAAANDATFDRNAGRLQNDVITPSASRRPADCAVSRRP